MRAILTLMFTLILTMSGGCAFRPGNQDDVSSDIQSSMDGGLTSVGLNWNGASSGVLLSARDLAQRDRFTWVRETPISIPRVPPEFIQVELGFRSDPQSLGLLDIQATATTGSGGISHPVGVEGIQIVAQDGGSRVTFALRGLSILLSAKREQVLFLDLNLIGGGRGLAKVRIGLSTPPSEWSEIGRWHRGQVPPTGRSRLPVILKSQALTLTLIERVIFRSFSRDQVKLQLPFRVKGRVGSTFRKFSIEEVTSLNPHAKKFGQVEADEKATTDIEFFMIPAVDEVETRWPEFSTESKRRLLVQPSQEIEVGLYAPADDIESAYAAQKIVPDRVQAQTGAQAKCPNQVPAKLPESVNGDEGRGWCVAASQVGFSYSPDAIVACTDSIRWMRACLASNWAMEPCNQAALADDKLDQLRAVHPDNGIPWPLWFSCRRFELTSDNRIRYIHKGWAWQPIFGEFLQGRLWKSSAIEFENTDESLGLLRFETGDTAADAEARPLQLFTSGIPLTEESK